MKQELLLLCISLSFTSTAQKIRFTDPRNRWVTEWGGGDGVSSYSGGSWYRLGPDTVINTMTYRYLSDSLSGWSCFIDQHGF